MGLVNFSLQKHQPLFGLEIGHANLKVMQLDNDEGKAPRVLGYGVNHYPKECVANGVIIDYEKLNKALYDLLSQNLNGTISTRKVACAIPTSRTFSRPMRLPAMDDKDIDEAVRLEAEQYIPVPANNLYINYEVIRRDDKNTELLMVAAPKNIIDSYVKFLQVVNLEPVVLEPTMNAVARLFSSADSSSNEASLLIDFGSIGVDLAVFDQTMFVNSTVAGGSDTINDLIAKQLGISQQEAYVVKNKEGLAKGPHQAEIMAAVRPMLENLIREIRKTLSYYQERLESTHRPIAQVITVGGGVNMPGLNDYFSQQLKLPTRMFEPWHKIDFGSLPVPDVPDRSMYITVAGEAMLDAKKVLADD